jgi:hypothetical protein
MTESTESTTIDIDLARARSSKYGADQRHVNEYIASLEAIITMIQSVIKYQIPAMDQDINFLREKFPERTTMKSYYLSHDDSLKYLPDVIVRSTDRIRRAMKSMYEFSK